MVKTNGKSQVDPEELDLEHELPPADEQTGAGQTAAPQTEGVVSAEPTEVQKLRAERDALLDRLARLQAEFENARKRAAREQQDFKDFATTDAIKALLPVLDSFERALRFSDQGGEFRSGVELIHKQLEDALAKLGVQAVPALGKQFDPRLHEAIEMVDRSDLPDHQVIEELQRGYRLKDRLLRPAMVKVARNPGR
ncbi:MAG TPA: nucleotide exchange factor GrpE [Terriglobales bacterium]|nr:nucleotide exchange factor GrpE [Terriglobales bacterium]